MSDLTPERLAELRAVAEAATPGPWEPKTRRGGDFQEVTLADVIVWSGSGQSSEGRWIDSPDIDHIASFDPPTVLALIAALEAKTAELERLTPKQPDGWSTQDRQEAKQEAERRWTDDRDGYQSDFDRGGINGFILGAEWQKARETFISYKTIADEAEAALERVRAWAEVLAGPYPDSYLSSRGVGENILPSSAQRQEQSSD